MVGWQIFAGSVCVVCCVYCRSVLYRYVFVLAGGGESSNLWGVGGPCYVFSVSPGDLLVWGYLIN